MNIAWGAITQHIWQSTWFAALAWLLTLALRSQSAQARYRVWLAASLKFFIPFSLLVAFGGTINLGTVRRPVKTIAPAVSVWTRPLRTALSEPIDPPYHALANDHGALPLVLAGIWLCGFLVVRGRWHREWGRIRAQLRRAEFPVQGREVSALRALDSRMRLALSAQRMEPAVFGVFRPVLLLPAGISAKLDDRQFRAILIHELCHARRRDNLAAALHMIAEAVFWFHPVVWWVGARMLEERERACDEEVLRRGAGPAEYASGILRVCEYCLESPLPCASGVTGADLKRRIEEIAANRTARRLGVGRRLLLAAAGGLAVLIPIAIGLAQDSRFEVATIKPTHYAGGPLRVTGAIEPKGINWQNQTLRGMIQRAYGVKPYQVNGPAWLATERYTVVARSADEAKEEQIMLMVRSLLAERFKLEFHRETKEMPVYALVAAKNGPKLKESKGEGATEIGAGEGPGIKFERASMGQLAGVLGRQVDLPVLDETGLTGLYDFQLVFNQDGVRTRSDAAASDPSAAPSVFTALQEQLGLKLESRRAPIEILVVDRAEKNPIEN
jgi:bla regulator protein blaR1